MKKNKRYPNQHQRRRTLGFLISICLVVTALSTVVSAQHSEQSNLTQIIQNKPIETLTYQFEFQQPTLTTRDIFSRQYTQLHMPGCLNLGTHAGAPALPVFFVQLALPPKTAIESIQATGNQLSVNSVKQTLQQTPVIPYQDPIPIGVKTEPSFAFDHALYASTEHHPQQLATQETVGFSHGIPIAHFALQPVQYVPHDGTLSYYDKITVHIRLTQEKSLNSFFRDNPDDISWVQQLVSNPDIVALYNDPIHEPVLYPGGLCDPADNYEYVIITTEQNGLDDWNTGGTIDYNWDNLIQRQARRGLDATVVTIEDITDCTDYHSSDPKFNDIEAHIREFCRDAYQDWETQYIFIGGDDEWIPARHMKYDYEGNVDSDLYWSNLDYTFNNDGDNYWGEEGDSGFDLYSELFIGRITCDNPQDASNWMKKSFYYADSADMDYLDNAGFYGGNTNWNAQGDDFVDYSAIKGTTNWLGPSPGAHGSYPSWLGFQYGFETWNKNNPVIPFDLSVKWTAEPPNPGWNGGSESAAIAGLRNAINNNQVTLISGIAHANENMALDVYDSSWESSYTNTRPFFLHDYGCHCGDMDAADDGVLHSMLFHSDTSLAFAVVFNTCYGWGSLSDTNSSSALQQKLFWDYLFDLKNHSGGIQNWQMGKAHAISKDFMAPTIDWYYSGAPGSWRGIIQGCLLFGDPAQSIKPPRTNDPPQTPLKPTGPSTGTVGQICEFTTSTTDPDDDSVLYQFDWGDGTTSDWVGPFNSGDIANATHMWTQGGTYEIRCRAKDLFEAATSWSATTSIYIGSPDITITETEGGIGVKTTFENSGDGEATNIQWTITITGGFGDTITLQQWGRIDALDVDETVTVDPFRPFFGIGRLEISIKADPQYGEATTEKIPAFLLGPFVLIGS